MTHSGWTSASAQVLGFVGRRLLAESVLLLFAVRETADERLFSRLPALTLDGLTDERRPSVAHRRRRPAIWTSGSVTGSSPRPGVTRWRCWSWPAAMSDAELAGGFAVPPTDDRFRSSPRPLPAAGARPPGTDATPDAAGGGRPHGGRHAVCGGPRRTLGVGPMPERRPCAEQLLEIGSRVRFRHPLVRPAAYAAGSPQDRRRRPPGARRGDGRHGPIPSVGYGTWPPRQPGPDEDVADELERTAGTAQARAGLAAAAAFLQRSVALTAEPARRADRALAAAEAHLHAGAFDAALGLLAEAAAVAVDDLQRARVEQLTGQIEAAAGPGREAPVRLLQAAMRLESLDVRLARDTYLQAWWAAVLAGRFAAPGGDLLEVCQGGALGAAASRDPGPATCSSTVWRR